MDRSYEGKAVLVTGGSRGIGLAIAAAFAGAGASVMIAGRNDGALDCAAAEMGVASGIVAY